MKQIFLRISEQYTEPQEGDFCIYRFDKTSLDSVTNALDKIQEDEAAKHYAKCQHHDPRVDCNNTCGCNHMVGSEPNDID